MGFLKKFVRDPPATTTDYVQDGNETVLRDIEKSTAGTEVRTATLPHYQHVHPEAEKRVVRKLDWRVPTLVSALCTLYCNFQITSTVSAC